MNQEPLQWHPGFYAALQIELEDDREHLTFESEHQLSEKPMSIDTLVIKVNPGAVITKNIGQIFRQHNIIEFKSPTDYVSMNDFYKVFGYTCFYQSDTGNVGEIKPEELTITFVSSHFPRKLMLHLHNAYHISYVEAFPGIYHLTGLLFPIQIITTEKLSKKDNFWLSRMRTDLKIQEDLEPLSHAYRQKPKDPRYEAVMDLLLRANLAQAKEAKYMCDAIRELFAEEYKEAKEEGETVKLINQVIRKRANGQTISEIAEDLLESPEQIHLIFDAIDHAPNNDIDSIYNYFISI